MHSAIEAATIYNIQCMFYIYYVNTTMYCRFLVSVKALRILFLLKLVIRYTYVNKYV